jgi:MFS transporter, DHA1 family, multidrug resistance protein
MVCVQMTVTASNQIASPFLPLYLVQLGVRPLSVVEYWTGAILAVSALSGAIFSPIWGALGDRVGRKRMVLRSSFASCISMVLMGISTTPLEMFGARVIMGAFAGFSTAAMALVASQAPEGRLGYALGWLSTGQITGTLLGPLIGGILADRLHDYRAVFFISAIGTGVLASGCAMLVRERPESRRIAEQTTNPWANIAALARRRDLAPMLLVIMLAQVCSIAIQPVLPLYVAHLVGDAPWRATATGAVVAATGVAGLLSTPFLGARADAFGYRNVLSFSLLGAACFTIPQAFALNVLTLFGLRCGVGLFLGGILPSANAIVGRSAKPEERGRVYGFTSSAQFLGRFSGPLVGAGLGAHFGFSAVCFAVGALMLLNYAWVLTAAPAYGPAQRGEA